MVNTWVACLNLCLHDSTTTVCCWSRSPNLHNSNRPLLVPLQHIPSLAVGISFKRVIFTGTDSPSFVKIASLRRVSADGTRQSGSANRQEEETCFPLCVLFAPLPSSCCCVKFPLSSVNCLLSERELLSHAIPLFLSHSPLLKLPKPSRVE